MSVQNSGWLQPCGGLVEQSNGVVKVACFLVFHRTVSLALGHYIWGLGLIQATRGSVQASLGAYKLLDKGERICPTKKEQIWGIKTMP